MTRAGGARKGSSGHVGRRLGGGLEVGENTEIHNRRFEPKHIKKTSQYKKTERNLK